MTFPPAHRPSSLPTTRWCPRECRTSSSPWESLASLPTITISNSSTRARFPRAATSSTRVMLSRLSSLVASLSKASSLPRILRLKPDSHSSLEDNLKLAILNRGNSLRPTHRQASPRQASLSRRSSLLLILKLVSLNRANNLLPILKPGSHNKPNNLLPILKLARLSSLPGSLRVSLITVSQFLCNQLLASLVRANLLLDKVKLVTMV